MISLDAYDRAAAYIRTNSGAVHPDTAIVLGSGLGQLGKRLTDTGSIPYSDIPGFPVSTVASHAGMLLYGRLGGQAVYVMSGRFHYYEGYDPQTVCFYIRVLYLLGVKQVILTNAAGAVNPAFSVGELMLISDHVKLFETSPVRGAHDPRFGDRFFDMTTAYSPRLRQAARSAASRLGLTLREGVYFFMPGPEFETPAEIRAIRTLGGDVVGMSTVMEAVAAVSCGMEVLGISCITNMASGMVPNTEVSDDEVTVNAALASDSFCALIEDITNNIV